MAAPLQSRVDPFGQLFAGKSRGLLMGNRGGRIHDDNKKLTSRRWSSRQWICCVLDFHGRHRDVWGDSYTELFFLDEPTAFAAGHRPCFECRHADAMAFAQRFGAGKSRARASDMDRALHAERLDGRAKRVHRLSLDRLPDGAFVSIGGEAFAVRGKRLLRWTPAGYRGGKPRPRGIMADVLTPPSMLRVLQKGYGPRWHPSAGR
jgi:hypothetical protein